MATISECHQHAVSIQTEMGLVMDRLVVLKEAVEAIQEASMIHKLPGEQNAAVVATETQLTIGAMEGAIAAMDVTVEGFGPFFGR
jgi:hypothetical protein